MSAIARRTRSGFGALVLLSLLALGPAASAQNRVPGPKPLEALVKGSLMSLNDANLTGDYRVFHARLSEPFRRQFTPDRLKQSFREFHDKYVDIDIICTLAPVFDQPPYVNAEGKLVIHGFFPTEPTRVIFGMEFIPSDGEWKLIRIDVKVAPSVDGPPLPEPAPEPPKKPAPKGKKA
jgi:hypothetical protein